MTPRDQGSSTSCLPTAIRPATVCRRPRPNGWSPCPTAAADFTVFADDAYAIHHLVEPERPAPALLALAREAGNPDRVILFGSTSKVTFASGGLAFTGMNRDNLCATGRSLLAQQSIGPNKVEQWRHVRFLRAYEGGLAGLMRDHCPSAQAQVRLRDRDTRRCARQSQTGALEQPEGWLLHQSRHHRGRSPAGSWNLPAMRGCVTDTIRRHLAGRQGSAQHPTSGSHRRVRPCPMWQTAMQVVVCCIKLASAEHDARYCRWLSVGLRPMIHPHAPMACPLDGFAADRPRDTLGLR